MNPYIICVNMPGYLPEQSPRAVATLDEAREAAQLAVIEGCATNPPQAQGSCAHLYSAATDLPETGGTIGPLPDGYVIDVQPIAWDELLALTDLPASGRSTARSTRGQELQRHEHVGTPWTHEEIIDAYNGNDS